MRYALWIAIIFVGWILISPFRSATGETRWLLQDDAGDEAEIRLSADRQTITATMIRPSGGAIPTGVEFSYLDPEQRRHAIELIAVGIAPSPSIGSQAPTFQGRLDPSAQPSGGIELRVSFPERATTLRVGE